MNVCAEGRNTAGTDWMPSSLFTGLWRCPALDVRVGTVLAISSSPPQTTADFTQEISGPMRTDFAFMF